MSQRGWFAVGTMSLALVLGGNSVRGQELPEKVLLDNETVRVVEITFPPAFKGRAHPALVNEMAYVLEGEFTVISIPEGKRVLKAGAVDWTTKGAIHSSRNDSTKPTRVLVILLKER